MVPIQDFHLAKLQVQEFPVGLSYRRSFTYAESRKREDEVITGGAAAREDGCRSSGGFISDRRQFSSKQEPRTAPKAFLSGLDMLLL